MMDQLLSDKNSADAKYLNYNNILTNKTSTPTKIQSHEMNDIA